MTAHHHRRVILLSDLHMAAGTDPTTGRPDPFAHDDALVGFLEHLADDDEPPTDVVLLGDATDLLEVELRHALRGRRPSGRHGAEAVLQEIVRAHPDVFAALGRLAAGPTTLHVVAGNHDIELADPGVQRALAALIGGSDADVARAVVFHPWMLHVDGLLYAEHGSQYHDINVSPDPLWPFRADGSVRRPPAALLERAVAAARLATHPGAMPGRRRHVVAAAVAGLRAVASLAGFVLVTGIPAAHRRRRADPARLAEHADATGLPTTMLARLGRLSHATVWSILRRLGRRWLRPARRGPDRRDYLEVAAEGVAAILNQGGHGVRFLVFGHTHAAGTRPLRSSPARYLNTGSWTRQAVHDVDTGPALTFAEVVEDPHGGASAQVWQWDDRDRRRRPFRPDRATQ